MKGEGSNRGGKMILREESKGGGNGRIGVEGKCGESERKKSGEGGFLERN